MEAPPGVAPAPPQAAPVPDTTPAVETCRQLVVEYPDPESTKFVVEAVVNVPLVAKKLVVVAEVEVLFPVIVKLPMMVEEAPEI